MVIQKANTGDHKTLTAITKQSKAYWGYSDEQIEAWSEALIISKTYIDTNAVYTLVTDTVIIGYYSFAYEDQYTVKLDNLFILPEYIGKGLGRLLMHDFLFRLNNSIIKNVILEADPNAESFYKKFGFVTTGQVATSIEGRYLPVMELGIEG